MRRHILLALLVLTTVCAWEPATAAQPPPGALKRDIGNCRVHAVLESCYDAIRWNPNDPVVLAALGDALQGANRPADALRAYQRAAELAPDMRGIGAKIRAAAAKLARSRAPHAAPAKHFSNAAPEGQSH